MLSYLKQIRGQTSRLIDPYIILFSYNEKFLNSKFDNTWQNTKKPLLTHNLMSVNQIKPKKSNKFFFFFYASLSIKQFADKIEHYGIWLNKDHNFKNIINVFQSSITFKNKLKQFLNANFNLHFLCNFVCVLNLLKLFGFNQALFFFAKILIKFFPLFLVLIKF